MNSFIQRGVPKSMGGMLLTAIFMLAFTCFSTSTTHAQGIQQSINYNWKTSDDAANILLSQVAILNGQMPGLTEGTSLYDNTVRRVAYFKAIIMEVKKGTTVVDALELSLPAAATLGFEKEASYTPRVILKALQTETRVMLTN